MQVGTSIAKISQHSPPEVCDPAANNNAVRLSLIRVTLQYTVPAQSSMINIKIEGDNQQKMIKHELFL